MNRYQVTRQDENCGPCRSIFVETAEQAGAAFDRALVDGAIFAEIFDMDLDASIRVEYPRLTWV